MDKDMVAAFDSRQAILVSFGWRMFSHHIEYLPQVDQSFSIQQQCLYRRTPCRRQSNDEGKIFIPRKMIAPSLSPWVKVVQCHQ